MQTHELLLQQSKDHRITFILCNTASNAKRISKQVSKTQGTSRRVRISDHGRTRSRESWIH